ncbi:hypothetical protein [[Pseudomonas] boreopolis]|uniref:Lipoprotein n=1 Tax=Xanthomonas boreopolis TaxID=86183 RepID=A0A919KK41_9XANT|nr:hypothetical protein GCM10009090_32160 [[Pseudomonas] boreopolis]
MKPIHRGALPALLLALSACKPQPAAPPVAPSPDPPARPLVSAPQAPLHEAHVRDAEQALQRLTARLERDKVYPDACNAYVLESGDGDGDRSFDIAVRERHGEGCPGDSQTTPVRDRFRVGRNGRIHWYDPIEGEFVDYAERAQRLKALSATGI